ncbi:transient receptor potential cation channel subfamily A member 1 homolog [Halichondria panicea]|uniref:transient receptor potential cation channel subfamily A member 1 homolog n=1 Tax=Halichondria panicea TaxID=6063 RepID=UPI00312B93BC
MDNCSVEFKPLTDEETNHTNRDRSEEFKIIEEVIIEGEDNMLDDVREWLSRTKEAVTLANEKGATALHLAASSFRIEVAKLLLENGADHRMVDQEEKTVLHYLCALPSVKNITAFFKLLQEKIDVNDVKAGDDENMTSLHFAAENGHLEVVIELLKMEADMKARDDIGDTPVHKAAEAGQTKVLKVFFKKDASCATLSGYNDETPLHNAVYGGHIETIKFILEHKPNVNTRSTNDETPLHLAAIEGSIEIAQLLLDEGAEVNPPSNKKFTKSPFHKAAFYGQTKLAIFLLEKNADVSNAAFRDVISEGYETIAKAIIEKHQWPLALRGRYKRRGKYTTALRELIVKMPAVAEQVLDHCIVESADNNVHEDTNYSVVYNYEFLEDVHEGSGSTEVSEVRTKNIVKSDEADSGGKKKKTHNTHGCSYEEICGRDSPPTWGPSAFSKEKHPLQIMVDRKELKLLKHPVVGSLLHYKWNKFGLIGYIVNLLTYAVFLSLLTAFALLVPNPQSPQCVNSTVLTENGTLVYCPLSINSTVLTENGTLVSCPSTTDELKAFIIASSAIVLLLALARFFFEIIQLYTKRLSYLTDWINWVEVIQYVTTIVFVVVYNTDNFCVLNWQWQIGVISIFLGWINLIVFFSKLPFVGIYVLILIKISITFFKMLLLTMLLIVSFGIPFFMVFFDANAIRSPFSDVPRSLLKVMTMTTGELDYDTIFRLDPSGGSDDAEEIRFPPISFILWIMFIILMPIILTNMLTSLAVGDTEEVQKEAQLQKLALQVDQALSMEELVVIFQKWFKCCVPKGWKRTKPWRKIFPNKECSTIKKLGFTLWEGERYDDIQAITRVLSPPENANKEVLDIVDTLNENVSKIETSLQEFKISVKENDDKIRSMDNTLKLLLEKVGEEKVGSRRNRFNTI